MLRGSRVALAAVVSCVVAVVAVPTAAWAADATLDRALRDPVISESSGLAASLLHPGVLWTVNDSGDEPRLYAVDPSGATVAVLTVDGLDARDWEALAAVRGPDGVPTLWVADIGDNRSTWESVRVHRIVEPADLSTQTVTADTYDLVYEDGPADAESLLADPATGALYVATKRASNPGLYELPAQLSADDVNVMSRVREVPPVVTDGAWNPVDGRFALVGYVYGWVYDDLGSEPTQLVLPRRLQGETVTWTPDGSALLVGSEGVDSPVWRVDVGGGQPSPTDTDAPATEIAPSQDGAVTPVVEEAGGVPVWLWALGGGLLAVGVVVVARRSMQTHDRDLPRNSVR